VIFAASDFEVSAAAWIAFLVIAPVLLVNWIDMSIAIPSVGLIGPCSAWAATISPPVW
jgi:hypothetical protein